MADEKNEGRPPHHVPQIKNAILCRVHRWGRTSFVMTLDMQLRADMCLVEKDVLAFRVMTWKGRRVMVGEKVPLSALANLKDGPPSSLGNG
jgi:hypothetical protein